MSSIPGFLRQGGVRLILLTFGLLLLAGTVQAYTVVLRGGRVVEIPNAFTVTATTVTYEVGVGIQVTLQLASINIPATERANHERAGSLLGRVNREVKSLQESEAIPSSLPVRSITNRELEPIARARRESEAVYDRRRRELGLPSLEESRQKAIAEAASMRERFDQSELDERASESYWRARATTLRTEIDAVDAEINTLRQQLDLLPTNNFNSVTVLTGGVPFVPFGHSVINPVFQSPILPAGVFLSPQVWPARDIQLGIRTGTALRQSFPHPFPQRRMDMRRRIAAPFFGGPNFAPFLYQSSDLSYERTALVTQLNELVARRAGLQARWRGLEDEARRAGAFPGWLRP